MFEKFKTIDFSATIALNTYRFSLAGIFRNTWFRLFGAAALILPLFGFLSQDIHLGYQPFRLFMDFQFGLQKWILFCFSLFALHSLWIHDENHGLRAALRSAGVQPLEHLLGKHAALFTMVIGFQLVFTIYIRLLIALWGQDPSIAAQGGEGVQATFPHLLAFGWSNGLMAVTVAVFIRLVWMLTSQSLLAYTSGVTIAIAGMSKPVWSPYFHYSEEVLWIFRIFGIVLDWIIPGMWQFDLWFVENDFQTGALLLQILKLTVLAIIWITIIQFASWKVATLKQD